MKDIQIDFRSGVPIYLQIVDQIRTQVLHGDLKPDDQLPTVRQMAADLRVNFNTIARAYRLLDEAGLISTQQGRGTFILQVPPADRNERIQKEALEELTRAYLKEATQFGFTSGEILSMIEFLQKESDPVSPTNPNHESRKNEGRSDKQSK